MSGQKFSPNKTGTLGWNAVWKLSKADRARAGPEILGRPGRRLGKAHCVALHCAGAAAGLADSCIKHSMYGAPGTLLPASWFRSGLPADPCARHATSAAPHVLPRRHRPHPCCSTMSLRVPCSWPRSGGASSVSGTDLPNTLKGRLPGC